MKKISIVIGVLILSFLLTGTAFGQMKNANAYFLLDNNLATAGYQGLSDVSVGSAAKVGFALYAKSWQQSSGIKVRFEWDGTKADYVKTESGLSIAASTVTINGASTALAAQNNIISNTLTTYAFTETSSAGLYENTYTLFGGSASTTAEGLIFFAVFNTAATFTTADNITIAAMCDVIDATGAQLPLGVRYFNVNKSNNPTDVKSATWKEVKDQFKDF